MVSARGLIGALLLGAAAAAAAATRHCEGIEVSAADARPQDAELACGAARDAVAFMAGHGFRLPRGIRLRVGAQLAGDPGHRSFGQYDAVSNVVEVLTYEAALRDAPGSGAFRLPMNHELYRSFVVHELAHAVARSNFSAPPERAAMEYIAYTAQLATLPPLLRAELLSRFATEGFGSAAEIGDQLLAFDPGLFAAKAWLHFSRPGNGAAFYQRLLRGADATSPAADRGSR